MAALAPYLPLDLYWQKAHDIDRIGICKPRIAQPSKDQVGIHVMALADLTHRYTGHTHVPADHPLLVVRPDLPLRHEPPR